MFATVKSGVVEGVDGHDISVEVHVSTGLPAYNLVGMPDAACRESRDRVRAAILSSGLKWPSTARVTINLAPAGLRKHGAALDLPIAIGVLAASGQVPLGALEGLGAVGELGLDGSVRAVTGLVCLAGAITAPNLLVPRQGSTQAAVARPGTIMVVDSLAQIGAWMNGNGPQPDLISGASANCSRRNRVGDLAEVRGQPMARWALEVAAAGGHHLLMSGPPGSGKTMLASRLVGLLPALSADEALLVTKIHSAAGLALPEGGLVTDPPLRAPHHGASLVALVGGGSQAMRPGEISCAHHGVLFLDEMGEFSPAALDSLRQPLEEGVVRVARAARSVAMPARFLLVAAMNPCPCGEGGSPGGCRCSDAARARYNRRLSGPLLDRFDLRVGVRRPSPYMLLDGPREESSQEVSRRVAAARELAAERGVRVNSEIPPHRLDDLAPLTSAARSVLRQALERHELTGRGMVRVRRVARTIADLRGQSTIDEQVIGSALALRSTLGDTLVVADRWVAIP